MANIRDLKKDINFALGDFIETVYQWEADTKNLNSDEGNALIDQAIGVFDELMQKLHKKDIANAKQHFKSLRADLEKHTLDLTEALGKLTA